MTDDSAGSKIAERLMSRPQGATMDEMIAATGGPQYNVLRRLEARGYRVRKVKEGRATRYFADAPATRAFEATVSGKGQLTIPREIRERVGLSKGRNVRLTLDDGRIVMSPKPLRLRDLAGILGKPPRSLTLEEMDDAIAQAAIERFRRATAR